MNLSDFPQYHKIYTNEHNNFAGPRYIVYMHICLHNSTTFQPVWLLVFLCVHSVSSLWDVGLEYTEWTAATVKQPANETVSCGYQEMVMMTLFRWS